MKAHIVDFASANLNWNCDSKTIKGDNWSTMAKSCSACYFTNAPLWDNIRIGSWLAKLNTWTTGGKAKDWTTFHEPSGCYTLLQPRAKSKSCWEGVKIGRVGRILLRGETTVIRPGSLNLRQSRTWKQGNSRREDGTVVHLSNVDWIAWIHKQGLISKTPFEL